VEPADRHLAGPYFIALATVYGRPDLPYQALHSTDPEIDLHRNGSAQVFDCGSGFIRFDFEQVLVEHHGQVAFRSQECSCPHQTFRYRHVFARSRLQCCGTLACALARRHKKDHDESLRNFRANYFA